VTAVITKATQAGTVYWYADKQAWIADADLASWYPLQAAETIARLTWPNDLDVAVESHWAVRPNATVNA